MSKLKIAGGIVAGGVLLLGGTALGAVMYANSAVTSVFDKTWETHEVDFPIPFPLTDAEVEELREQKAAELPEDAPEDADPLEGVDLDALALERAIARGKHYTESIYGCAICHGATFTGGTMIDDPAIGTLLGPNITRGGKTKDYKPSDWDRAVRHGVLPSGKTSMMPVGDFKALTDRELSDIVAFISSMPEQEGSETIRDFGPVGTMLVATGQLVPDVYKVKDHQAAHAAEPPTAGPTVEYGAHIINICTGCHREELNGGPMPFGPPDWPPAGNLTPHEQGLKGWTQEDFKNALTKAKRPDGTTLQAPMSEMVGPGNNMTDDEIAAMWAYLSQIDAHPTGE